MSRSQDSFKKIVESFRKEHEKIKLEQYSDDVTKEDWPERIKKYGESISSVVKYLYKKHQDLIDIESHNNEERLKQCETEKLKLSEEIYQLHKLNSDLKIQLEQCKTDLEGFQGTLKEQEKQKKDLEEKLQREKESILQEKENEKEANIKLLQQLKEGSHSDIEKAKQELEKYKENLANKQQINTDLEKQIQTLKDNIATHIEQNQSLKSDIQYLNGTISKNINDITRLKTNVQYTDSQMEKLKEENEMLKSEKDKAYQMLKILLNTGLVISKKKPRSLEYSSFI